MPSVSILECYRRRLICEATRLGIPDEARLRGWIPPGFNLISVDQDGLALGSVSPLGTGTWQTFSCPGTAVLVSDDDDDGM
ncbi:hypothetical protein TWF281_003584 [Arthrobotrys megalospora]